MGKDNFFVTHAVVLSDILKIFRATNKFGWKGISDLTIQRIIFLAAVMYSFRTTDEKNPFQEDYEFHYSYRGPHSPKVNNALNFLLTNHYIIFNKDENEYSIEDVSSVLNEASINNVIRDEWINTVIHIIAIYGENKIYDFVFRDPSYRENYDSQSLNNIDLSNNNKTIITLNEFKAAFEEEIGAKIQNIENKKYIELYFEYIFSKIIKGTEEDI